MKIFCKIFNLNKPFLHQEVWACWRELLSYLDAENKWLNEIELKLKATENVQGGAEEISESLDVSADLSNTKSHVLINCKFHVILSKLRTNITHQQGAEYLESPELSLDSANEVLNSNPPISNNN